MRAAGACCASAGGWMRTAAWTGKQREGEGGEAATRPRKDPRRGIETECLRRCDEVGFRSLRHVYDESGTGGSGGGLDGASRMTIVTMPPTRGALRGENSTRS